MGNKAVSSLLLQTSYITQVGGGGRQGRERLLAHCPHCMPCAIAASLTYALKLLSLSVLRLTPLVLPV